MTIIRRTRALALAALLAVVSLLSVGVALPGAPRPLAAEPVASAWPAAGVTIVANRCHGSEYTEMTVVACTRAVATGARVVDADVRFTRTGVPVALHSADLGVFGASGVAVESQSYTQAAQHVSPQLQNLATVRHLRDVAAASGADLSIEPMVAPTPAQWVALDDALGPLKSRTTLASFDLGVLAAAQARGYTRLALNAVTPPTYVPPGVRVVILKADAIDGAEIVARIRNLGVTAVWCYGCDTAAGWDALALELGVTGFVTDQHDAAEVWVAAHS